jgi:peroxiredoxin
MQNRKPLLVGLLLGVLIIGGMGLLVFTGAGDAVGRIAAGANTLEIGSQAPGFSLYMMNGRVLQSDRLRGKPVILAFGTTGCDACSQAAQLLQNLADNFPQLQVVWVDLGEDPSIVGVLVDDLGLTYTVALDPRGETAAKYKITADYALPAFYILDEQGVVRSASIGKVDEAQVYQDLETIGVKP